MQSNSDAYVAAWFSQDIANAAAVAKTFVQSRNDAHDQRVTVTLFLVIIIVVGDQCSHWNSSTVMNSDFLTTETSITKR